MKHQVVSVASMIMLSICGCGENGTVTDPPDDGPTEGSLRVTTTTSGIRQDADGYSVQVGTTTQPVFSSGSVTFAALSPGTHSATLTGLSHNCVVQGDNPQTTTVTAGATADVTFDIGCMRELAFHMVAEGNPNPYAPDLYLINEDGSGLINLTNQATTSDGSPNWSPDGEMLAFRSSRDGDNEVFIMNADGTGLVQLTDNDASDYGPVWSPDGTKILFVSERDGASPIPNVANSEIYVMDADGSNVVNLSNDTWPDGSPAWSPDGSSVAFMSLRDGNEEIYTVQVDGTGLANFTQNAANDESPQWSPDGARIMFTSDRVQMWDLFTLRTDGTDLIDLTQQAFDLTPEAMYSPDGTTITFRGEAGGYGDIYSVSTDGTGLTNLNPEPNVNFTNFYPVWSSDGLRIAFLSNRDDPPYGDATIYVMDADGSNESLLSTEAGVFGGPAWRPHGGM